MVDKSSGSGVPDGLSACFFARKSERSYVPKKTKKPNQ